MTIKDFTVEKNGKTFRYETTKEGGVPIVRYTGVGLANLWVKYELRGDEKKRIASVFIRRTASRARIISVFGG